MTKRQIKEILLRSFVVLLLIVGLHGVGRAIAFDLNRPYPSVQLAGIGVGPVTQPDDIPCGSLRDHANQGGEVELVAEVVHDTGKFQMWLHEEQGTVLTTVSKVTDSGICVLAYTPYDEEITNRVPLDVARDLSLQLHHKLAAARGGMDAYRAEIVESFTVDNTEVFDRDPNTPGNNETGRVIPPAEITSIDKWVFDQLQIVLPEGTYIVRDIDNAWEYDSDRSGQSAQ